ncbi:MAG: AsnC family transcriptional regulator [Actinomycetia bacterium]|nr:AsnC family transcriptional regulator [Actinomycetes bacterium]
MTDGYAVDPTDRELLQLLTDNARIPVAVLARELGLEEADVERRITKMEEIGIIKAYRAVIDPYLYSLYFHENGPLGPRALFGNRKAARPTA